MSDLCVHGQSLLIWVFFEDPQGELTGNVYDDDDYTCVSNDEMIIECYLQQTNLNVTIYFFFFTLIRQWDVTTSRVSDHQQCTMRPQD